MEFRLIFIVLGLTLCFGKSSSAQQRNISKNNSSDEDTSQLFVAHWKKGEVKTYSITHTKVKSEDGRKPDSTSFTYWATLKVIDSSINGYRLLWNYILPPSSLNISQSNDIYEFYKGLNIYFETEATGEFIGVSNWQELRDHYVKMFELTVPKKNNETVDSVLEKVKQMFDSKQMVEATMAKEIMLLLQSYGGTYSTKSSVFNTTLPNPLIPVRPIPAILSVKISEINPKIDYFKLQIEQNIDKDGAFQLFESVFDKMNLPKDSVMAKANDMLSNFEINDYCEVKASMMTGWVTSLFYIRKGSSQMLSQRDSYLIEMKE